MEYFFRKNFSGKRKWLSIGILILIAILGFNLFKNHQTETEVKKAIKKVAILELVKNNTGPAIEASGVVKAVNSAQLVALTRGTVLTVDFELGDKVEAGQILAQLHDDNTLTNANNARTAYNNAFSNYLSTQSLLSDSINQADLGVKNAEAGLETAQISADSAQANYDDGMEMQTRRSTETLNSAVVTYNEALSAVSYNLNQLDYVKKGENGNYSEGLDSVFGILDMQLLIYTRDDYDIAKELLQKQNKINVTTANVTQQMNSMIKLLDATLKVMDRTMLCLNNTVTYIDFTEADLATKKSILVTSRSSFGGTVSGARAVTDTLNNLELNNKQEKTRLENALKVSQKQLEIAKLGLENAKTALESTKKTNEQRTLAAQSGVDSAAGQLAVMQNLADYLTVKAPISGQISQKMLEVGKEINAGQTIAEVSQNELVKIEIEIDPQQASLIKTGEDALIEDQYYGYISAIAPSADQVSRKVKVQVTFDNRDHNLIMETTAKVALFPKFPEDNKTLFIPLKALTMGQMENYVFVYDDQNQVAKKVWVKIGQTAGERVEVLEGLSLGQKLIIEGNKLLTEGEKVELNQ